MLVTEVFGKVLKVSDSTFKRYWKKLKIYLLDMKLLPEADRLLILPYSAEEVAYRLNRVTKPSAEKRDKHDAVYYQFHGEISSSRFKISPMLKYPDNFVPIIKGKIEKTSKGCIVFMTYKLFYSTKIYLLICGILSTLVLVGFLFWKPNFTFALGSLLFFLINYWACFAGFKRHKRHCHQIITKHLN